MSFIGNFFNKILNREAVTPINQSVPGLAGPVFTVSRLLGSSSNLALVAGTNNNLTINSTTGVISATADIAGGATQLAKVRETNGLLAVEYPVNLTSIAAAVSAITSPGTYTQPARTQRYVQETSSTAGTWSLGSGGDADKFTIDSTTGVRALTDTAITNLSNISSDQTLSLPLIFTQASDGSVSNKTVAVTVKPTAEAATLSDAFFSDFSGPNGTLITATPGLAVYAKSGVTPTNLPRLDGNGRVIGRGHEGGIDDKFIIAHAMTDVNAGTLYRVVFERPLAGNSNVNYSFVFAADGPDNSVIVTLFANEGGVTVNGLRVRQNGTNTDLNGPGLGNVSFRDDATMELQAQVSSDGKNMSFKMIGASIVTGKTISLENLTLGKMVGVGSWVGYAPGLGVGAVLRSIRAVRPATLLTVTSAPTYSTGNKAVFKLNWSGRAFTKLRHRTLGVGDVPTSTWMTGESVVTGTSSGEVTYTATVSGAGDKLVEFQIYDDTGVRANAPNNTIFMATAARSFSMGYNIDPSNYYNNLPMVNDWGKVVDVRSDGSIYIPAQGITGWHTVTTEVGVQLFSGHSTVPASDFTSNPSTGVHRFRVANDMFFPDNVRAIKWGSKQPTRFEVVREGRSGVEISSEWVNSLEGGWLRDLNTSNANAVPLKGPLLRNTPSDPFWRYGEHYGQQVPYQTMCKGMAAWITAKPTEAKGWWHVIGVDEDDSFLTAKFTEIRDRLLVPFPDFELALEWGNEWPWNIQFTGTIRTWIEGVEQGYWGDATAANPKPFKSVTVGNPLYGVPARTDANGNPVPGSNTLTHDVAAGEWIIYNLDGVGLSIWEAKQNAPAGTFVNENSFFTRRSDIDLALAAHRWGAVRFSRIIALAKRIFGSAYSRVIPVRSGFAASDMNYLNAYLNFVPGHLDEIKGLGHAWYVGNRFDFDTTTATKNNIDANIRENLVDLRVKFRKMTVDCLRLGKRLFCYEGRLHPAFDPYSQGGSPGHENYNLYRGYRDGWDSLMADPVMGRALNRDIILSVKEDIPGVCCAYILMNRRPWAIKFGPDDVNNPQRLGINDALAVA